MVVFWQLRNSSAGCTHVLQLHGLVPAQEPGPRVANPFVTVSGRKGYGAHGGTPQWKCEALRSRKICSVVQPLCVLHKRQ